MMYIALSQIEARREAERYVEHVFDYLIPECVAELFPGKDVADVPVAFLVTTVLYSPHEDLAVQKQERAKNEKERNYSRLGKWTRESCQFAAQLVQMFRGGCTLDDLDKFITGAQKHNSAAIVHDRATLLGAVAERFCCVGSFCDYSDHVSGDLLLFHLEVKCHEPEPECDDEDEDEDEDTSEKPCVKLQTRLPER